MFHALKGCNNYSYKRLKLIKKLRIAQGSLRCIATSVQNKDGLSEDEQAIGRQWLASFSSKTIPKNLCEVTYSRASGPGGQKVNK